MDRSSIVEFMENLFCQGQWLSCTLYTCWNYIKTAILESCNRFIPKVRIPSTLSPRWFNADVRHKLNKVRTLRRRLKSKPTPQLATKLSRTEDLLAVQMQRSKEKFILELISTFIAQPKRLYSYISSLSSTKPQISSILYNGCNISDPHLIVLVFFHSTFISSDFCLPPVWLLPTPVSQLGKIEITAEDVFGILSNLDTTKAMGCDQIHPTVLKLCADTLSIPFCKLFSDSLDQGVIPPEWKVHKICPIPKIVNPGCVENFRPISLLCLTGKIIEKLIYNKIIDFVREKISIHQHGFLKGRSCLSQLISSYAYINDQLDKNCAIDVVYLDFNPLTVTGHDCGPQ